MEKTELQSEGLEGLKIINSQLREQMQHQGKEVKDLQEKIAALEARQKANDAAMEIVRDMLLKQNPKKR